MGKLNFYPIYDINGLIVVETSPYSDHRGAFSRLFCQKELTSILGTRNIMQINHSLTDSVGAIRGLHFQYPPHAEMKLVRCLKGCVWDVVVDLRKGSPTFLNWHAEELSKENSRMLVIPEGCAHGFQVLEERSELLYLHTAIYEISAEGGIRYNDNFLGINWPLPVNDLSERDENHPLITNQYKGISL